jgi:hypothetical protein
MRSTGFAMLASLLFIAGCGSDTQTKNEKAARGIDRQECSYAGATYSQGALLCQEKTGMKCDNGFWREWTAGEKKCAAPHEQAAAGIK